MVMVVVMVVMPRVMRLMPIAERMNVMMSSHGFLESQRIVSVCQTLTRLVFESLRAEELLEVKTKEKT